MSNLLRFLPFLASALLCAFIGSISDLHTFGLPIILLPGILFGAAIAVFGISLPGYSFPKAMGTIAISSAMHAAFYFATLYTWGLLGSPLGAAAGILLGLLAFRFQANSRPKRLWVLPLLGFIGWWSFYIPDLLHIHNSWVHPFVMIYLIWQLLVGAGMAFLVSVSSQGPNSAKASE